MDKDLKGKINAHQEKGKDAKADKDIPVTISAKDYANYQHLISKYGIDKKDVKFTKQKDGSYKTSLADLETLEFNTSAKYDNLSTENQTAMTKLNQYSNDMSTHVQLCSSMLNTIYQSQVTAVRSE